MIRSDFDTLYEALLNRDPSYDGRVYVCVASTGIFCRLTCPARKPKRENCTFYATVAECIDAGFRPCKRCKPTTPQASADPVVKPLIEALEGKPGYRWREPDIVRMGLDPSTVRRAFKRHFGMTFLEMARQRRLQEGFSTLAEGGKVIDAQITAGFESPSAFREAFAKILGQAPGTFSQDPMLFADWVTSPLGPLIAVTDRTQLHLLEFLDRRALPAEFRKLQGFAKGNIGFGRTEITDQIQDELRLFFDGSSGVFETKLALHGSTFTRDVWRELLKIPAGGTRSYSELARELGRPEAVRAVARANGANQIAIVVPCHRVLGADGSLTGYGGGLWRKQRLIELERSYSSNQNAI
ncbi:AraC family transcriptional regulator of adaptative response/methylated-DNA-[protein]-cysteine methyltransferase [Labrenzia sp. EL_159]|nr:AraC family transcriptional regulator of adaptative response/methylated-DNA-[protein]-cysteine methyltransferase [Labrenzia sp. EL_162]MBG6161685.1 AraC family transcriptional regulator of adaptative response/methylated-DNA-[protein]-cysteine methyltransferase [Labrenzia sp. EL_195]MBG6193466.1 AraC family transcriptional regulator of adaptative response/methylated-DNA-[protein]-cysteine methyltransferase [Labrenzia sp. EL_159]